MPLAQHTVLCLLILIREHSSATHKRQGTATLSGTRNTPTLPPHSTHRFTITHGNKVDWLGWSLYVGYLPHHGGRFWDIRFKGERIVYELSLQEAMAGE